MAMAMAMAMAGCRSLRSAEEEEEARRSRRKRRLEKKRVGFTTPAGQYSDRLQKVLESEGAVPVWAPTVRVELPSSSSSADGGARRLRQIVSAGRRGQSPLAGIAFTSRAGIAAIHEALLLDPGLESAIARDQSSFFLAALGRDADLVLDLDLFGVRSSVSSVRLIVPVRGSTPEAMAEELGLGHGRSVLCPVPCVRGRGSAGEGLDEPPVVPGFLSLLASNGWIPVRIDAYTTSWAGPLCALPLLPISELDALVFTSTAEAQGLLLSFHSLGILPPSGSSPLIAAHGPVTAAGAARSLGFPPHVVSSDSSSFHGIADALHLYWTTTASN